MPPTITTSIRFCVLILIAMLVGGSATIVSAQTPTATSLDLGAQPTVSWDHDLTHTTHFRLYQATVSPTGVVGAVTRIAEIPKPAVGGSIEVVWPVKFSSEGTFNLYVSAVNKPVDPALQNESESPRTAPLQVKVAKPTLPMPSTPFNFRVIVKVAVNRDGTTTFQIERIEAAE